MILEICLTLPPWCWGDRYTPLHLVFICVLGELSSGPHGCVATTLLTESFPQLQDFSYLVYALRLHLMR